MTKCLFCALTEHIVDRSLYKINICSYSQNTLLYHLYDLFGRFDTSYSFLFLCFSFFFFFVSFRAIPSLTVQKYKKWNIDKKRWQEENTWDFVHTLNFSWPLNLMQWRCTCICRCTKLTHEGYAKSVPQTKSVCYYKNYSDAVIGTAVAHTVLSGLSSYLVEYDVVLPFSIVVCFFFHSLF